MTTNHENAKGVSMAIKILKGNKKGKLVPREHETTSKYELPIEKSEPSDSLQDYSILIYGAKKIGKTSLCAQFEDTLGFMTEPGGRAQSMYQVACNSWQDLRGYTKLFIKDNRFKTGVVDTADIAYEMCLAYVCKKMVIDHPSDEGYGKGWQAVRKEFQSWVMELLGSGKGVIFLSHSKDSDFKTRRGETFSKVGASMAGQAADVIQGLVDIWANYTYDGKKRFLIIGGSEEVDAGSRVEGHFMDPHNGSLDRIPMGQNAKEAYRNFVAAFNNKLQVELEETVAPKKKLIIKKK